jgi:hypothetical protein
VLINPFSLVSLAFQNCNHSSDLVGRGPMLNILRTRSGSHAPKDGHRRRNLVSEIILGIRRFENLGIAFRSLLVQILESELSLCTIELSTDYTTMLVKDRNDFATILLFGDPFGRPASPFLVLILEGRGRLGFWVCWVGVV